MTAETLATIETLRAMGARKIRVGDVEVEFASAPAPSTPRERERTSPEEMQRRAREQEEALLFAASG